MKRIILILGLSLSLAAPAFGQTFTLYRCQRPDGTVFTQKAPCPPGTVTLPPRR